MNKKYKVTFDTSCVISLLRLTDDGTPLDELNALKNMVEIASMGQLELYVSEKNRTESKLGLEKSKQSTRSDRNIYLKKWTETLKVLPEYQVTDSAWVLGLSRLGVDTDLRKNDEDRVFREIIVLCRMDKSSEAKMGDIFDYAILFEHYLNGNDVFVTRDTKNGILDHKGELREKWGIVALNPIDALVYINNL